MPRLVFVGFDAAPSDEVSSCWRFTPLLIYLFIIVVSIAGSVSIGTAVERFHSQCPLYATPRVETFDGVNITLNEEATDPERTRWGDMNTCYLTEFFPIFCVIFAASWFFFFCMCGKGGKGSSEGFGMDSPWRIVCPGFCFNFIMCAASLVCSVWTTNGVAMFCKHLDNAGFANLSCVKLDGLKFNNYPDMTNLNTWLTLAQVCSWVVFSGFLSVTLLLALRCLLRPDLTPLYARVPSRSNLAQRRQSADSFLTADSSPKEAGAWGDSGPSSTQPLVHHNAEDV